MASPADEVTSSGVEGATVTHGLVAPAYRYRDPERLQQRFGDWVDAEAVDELAVDLDHLGPNPQLAALFGGPAH